VPRSAPRPGAAAHRSRSVPGWSGRELHRAYTAPASPCDEHEL